MGCPSIFRGKKVELILIPVPPTVIFPGTIKGKGWAGYSLLFLYLLARKMEFVPQLRFSSASISENGTLEGEVARVGGKGTIHNPNAKMLSVLRSRGASTPSLRAP